MGLHHFSVFLFHFWQSGPEQVIDQSRQMRSGSNPQSFEILDQLINAASKDTSQVGKFHLMNK